MLVLSAGLISCKKNSNNVEDDSSSYHLEVAEYPLSTKGDVVDDYFGVSVADPYRWMELDTSADVKSWVQSQNKFTKFYLDQIPFRDKIEQRLTELYDYEKKSAPFRKGDRLFYYKNTGLQDQSVLHVLHDGKEQVFIDPNALSDDGTVALSSLSFSRDNKFVAYTVASVGSDWKTMRIRNVETGEEFDETLDRLKFGSAAWSGEGFFYSAYDAPEKGMEYIAASVSPSIYYHKLGQKQEDDQLVFENTSDAKRYLWPRTSWDEKHLFVIESQGTHGNQIHHAPINGGLGKFSTLFTGFEFDYNIVTTTETGVLVHTNRGASNYRIIEQPFTKDKDETVVLPECDEVMLGASVVSDRLFVHYLKDATSKIVEYNMDGSNAQNVDLPGLGQINGFSADRDEKELYYSFSSYVNPATAYHYDLESRKSKVYFKSDFAADLSQYESNRVWYTSKDGTKIPMIITHKKGIALNGKNPTLLYGYGGFNISIRPGFKIPRMVFLENGGILAVPNLRGGGEYGESWHHDGMLEKKQNVFDDFIAAAEFLIQHEYTDSAHLAIEGRSNGGLLVGAVMTQKPELFKAALPTVGVLDMLRYHKFTVGWGWAVEYGSSDNKEDFEYLIKYSPLHNVKEVDYPATMVLTGDHDDRVVPAHSYKFAATLQEKHTGSDPVLIRIEENAGHGAGKPISKHIEENADILSFLMFQLGMEVL